MRVLLATDGSLTAEKSAALLARIPHRDRLELSVVYVNNSGDFHGVVDTAIVEQSKALGRERGKLACERVSKMFVGANAAMDSAVIEGHPGTTIVDRATALGVDLVVIGATGHSALDRMILGSVSDFVATHAPCSVLVVRPDLLSELHQHEPRICIAYDGSGACDKGLKSFCEFGWFHKMKLDVVGVMPTPTVYSEVPIPIDHSASKNAMHAMVAQGVEICRQVANEVYSHVIESDYIGDGLVRFSTETKSDLIVVGDTGKGLLGRFFMGSVSRYVLRHATCSVWIGREKKTAPQKSANPAATRLQPSFAV